MTEPARTKKSAKAGKKAEKHSRPSTSGFNIVTIKSGEEVVVPTLSASFTNEDEVDVDVDDDPAATLSTHSSTVIKAAPINDIKLEPVDVCYQLSAIGDLVSEELAAHIAGDDAMGVTTLGGLDLDTNALYSELLSPVVESAAEIKTEPLPSLDPSSGAEIKTEPLPYPDLSSGVTIYGKLRIYSLGVSCGCWIF